MTEKVDKVNTSPNLDQPTPNALRNRANLEGKTLGQYQILNLIGRGGMAHVYRAQHSQIDRQVAVKVMRSNLTDDETFVERFRDEARAIASLRHPHIVQLFDFNITDEAAYMVTELKEGGTLKNLINDYKNRREQMPLGEVVRALLDALEGLDYAHQQGMIHRDIKPSNILLTKDGNAVLGDFGLAQIMGKSRHTMTGALMGTLDYMAPEQGLEGKTDVRSDLYSMGIVFYEILFQKTPFDAEMPLATLMLHLNEPVQLPESAELPSEFEVILFKSLAKKPDERYQSVREMVEDLKSAVSSLNIPIPNQVTISDSVLDQLANQTNLSSPTWGNTVYTKFDDMSMFYKEEGKDDLKLQVVKDETPPKTTVTEAKKRTNFIVLISMLAGYTLFLGMASSSRFIVVLILSLFFVLWIFIQHD